MPRITKIKLRADTAANWATADAAAGGAAVAAGETVMVDNDIVKGDGSTAVVSLPRVGSGTYVPIISGSKMSAVKTDGTDQTATLAAELASLNTFGGGTLVLPNGTVTCEGTFTLPNDNGTSPAPKMNPLALIGQGARWSGYITQVPTGGTVLDVKGTDSYGKIKTNGIGLFRVEGITFMDSAGTATPFIYTTNTTVQAKHCAFIGSKTTTACDQDAIILGGVNQVENGHGWDDGFQGYGTVISENYFNKIRRAVYGRAFCNGVVIRDNTVWVQSGSNLAGGAAIEIHGNPGTGAQSAVGNVITGNLIECVGYPYPIKLTKAVANTLSGNNCYDASATTIAFNRFEDDAPYNTLIAGFYSGKPLLSEGTGSAGLNVVLDTLGGYSNLLGTKISTYSSPLELHNSVNNIKFAPPTDPTNRSIIFTSASDGIERSSFASYGKIWKAEGIGAAMSQDSGTGGSYFDHKNYAVRFYDHNGGPLRARIGAGKDGIDFGANNDATVQRAAAGIVNVGKLAVTNTAAATTPGSVTKKMEIFDAAGTSLGFIAVYSSIT